MTKTKLIYIVGYGHSGSTLLNIILGSSKNVFSLGEISSLKYCIEKYFVKRFFENKKLLCTCGNHFDNCEYWSDVKNIIVSKKLYHPGTNKLKILLLYLIKRKRIFEEEKLFKYLCIKSAKFKGYRIDYLLDSSKDPFRLLYLKFLESVDLYVIHVIRDGRGVINSCEKMGLSLIRTLVFWLITNLIIKIILVPFDKSKYLTISYDLFANNPKKYLENINKKFGIKINLENYIEEVNQENYHHFHGNILGWRTLKSIYYDESWKRRMPIWKQYLVTLLTFFPNYFWVYKKKLHFE